MSSSSVDALARAVNVVAEKFLSSLASIEIDSAEIVKAIVRELRTHDQHQVDHEGDAVLQQALLQRVTDPRIFNSSSDALSITPADNEQLTNQPQNPLSGAGSQFLPGNPDHGC